MLFSFIPPLMYTGPMFVIKLKKINTLSTETSDTWKFQSVDQETIYATKLAKNYILEVRKKWDVQKVQIMYTTKKIAGLFINKSQTYVILRITSIPFFIWICKIVQIKQYVFKFSDEFYILWSALMNEKIQNKI